MITALFWLFVIIISAGIIACLGATLCLLRYFRTQAPSPQDDQNNPEASLIVPIKGVTDTTLRNLQMLLNSDGTQQCEFIFAMEGTADPAFTVCSEVKEQNPGKNIRILITGDSGERMGKQHNLCAAIQSAKHEYICSMDADVTPNPGLFLEGIKALSEPKAGIAFSLPYYSGTGPAGGTLLAVHINYYFSLYIGGLAALVNPPFISGAFWFSTKCTIDIIGGLEQFTKVAGDDARMGRECRRHGLRNIMLPRPVRMEYEQLRLRDGIAHLQKWAGLLRSEGLPIFWAALTIWHPLLFAFPMLICMFVIHQTLFPLFFVALFVKISSVFVSNKRVFGVKPSFQFAGTLLYYEMIIAPFLFARGLWKNTLTWKDKTYRIGKDGLIVETTPARGKQASFVQSGKE